MRSVAKDVDTLFVDNARLLREFVALGSDCYFFLLVAVRALTSLMQGKTMATWGYAAQLVSSFLPCT